MEVVAGRMVYVDGLIDDSGRMITFWFLASYFAGEINLLLNPATDEAITDAGWFSSDAFPDGHVFPGLLRDHFWADLKSGFAAPIKLPF